ncbi:Ser-Thr-rich glycosyl-phosphatidyl-inositol-anchored membrane family-domain-containing protein [Aspergillus spectabilis]
MHFITTGLISALVAFAAAYTNPDYSQTPTGNPILTPSLDEQVPAGLPYTITWDPTTQGPVSLVLLHGPSANVVPMAIIAENISNDGEYVWTPSSELQPDVTHYGLLLVVEAGPNKGQYQYSTQFGVSNPEYGEDNGSSNTTTNSAIPTVSTPSSASTTHSHETATKTTTTITTPTTTATTSTATTSTAITSTSTTSTSTTSTATTSTALTTEPSGQATFTPAPPQYTGAACRNTISLGTFAAGLAAVLAI